MKKDFLKRFLQIVSCMIITFSSFVFAQNTNNYPVKASRFNINRIATTINADGTADGNGLSSLFEYPKGSGYTAVFASGFVWGGKINGLIKVAGSTYRSGLVPGRIKQDGTPEDNSLENVRVYCVRPAYLKADLSMEADDEEKSEEEIFQQYEKDSEEWPADYGAPFKDVNGNGKYEAGIDIPGVEGADQTLWFIANDLDSTQTKYLYGSTPIGIEMQTTVWGYNKDEPLGNFIFKRYVIINKSNDKIEDMYFGIWSDPDICGAYELVGCDTTLDLAYMYYGEKDDNACNGHLPAVGFLLLQGPVIEGEINDKAIFMDKETFGKKNLPMTALSYLYKSSATFGWSEPKEGDYEKGTLYMYNLLQGLLGDGSPHPLPVSLGSGSTKFPFSGDPLTQTGFVGGKVTYPNGEVDGTHDHRMMLCSGPFNMAPGDTQEVVFAQVVAGSHISMDNIQAVGSLKNYAAKAKKFYPDMFDALQKRDTLKLSAAAPDNSIILKWGEDFENVKTIESGNNILKFQGYNIYQLPVNSRNKNDGKLITTYDIKDGVRKIPEIVNNSDTDELETDTLQFGTDSGIARFIKIKKDYLKEDSLVNYSQYRFGVSYYDYSDVSDFFINSKENELSVVDVVLQPYKPGIKNESHYGDEISINHISGYSNAELNVMIVDPTELTGDNYEISFQENGEVKSFTVNNNSENKTLLTGQTNLTGDDDCLITDGFIIKIKDNADSPLTGDDLYNFTAPGISYEENLIDEEIDQVNVFPNPFYLSESGIVDGRWYVTFTHLPDKATIRILNLAGQQVVKLEKNDTNRFLNWYLSNDHNNFVASGMYIALIEMPEIGRTKILKLAVIQ